MARTTGRSWEGTRKSLIFSVHPHFDCRGSIELATANDAAAIAKANAASCNATGLQSELDTGGIIAFHADCTVYLQTDLTVPAEVTVTINGSGHHVVLNGQGSTQILNDQGNVTLDEVTLMDGTVYGTDGDSGDWGTAATDPGASGTDGGSAESDGLAGQGGGVFVATDSVLKVTGSTFSNDFATGGTGGYGGPGGGGACPWIYTWDTPCDDWYSNGSGGDGGDGGSGTEGGPGQGGAIYSAGSLTVTDSTFVGDVASGGNGGNGGSGGGGAAGFGSGNTGGDGGDAGDPGNGGDGAGSAIYSEGPSSISGSQFTNDGAAGGLGGDAGSGGRGGNGGPDVQ